MESLVKSKLTLEIKDLKNIVFIESLESFININYLDKDVSWFDLNFDELDNYLPGEKFFRINKSFIINADYIKKIKHNRAKRIVLHDDLELEIEDQRYESLICFLRYKYII